MRRLLVVWAVLDGAVPRCASLAAAASATAAAHGGDAPLPAHRRRPQLSRRPCGVVDKKGEQGARRHRCQEGAKRACGAPDKREGLRATSQKHSGHVTEVTDGETTLKL